MAFKKALYLSNRNKSHGNCCLFQYFMPHTFVATAVAAAATDAYHDQFVRLTRKIN